MVRSLAALAALLYVACFFAPDYRIGWATGPGRPGAVEEVYFLSSMVSATPAVWKDTDVYSIASTLLGWGDTFRYGVHLDRAGWLGHLACVVALGLLVVRCGRSAAVAAAVGLAFGLARQWTVEPNSGFGAGYYAWLASMAVVFVAGVFRRRPPARRPGCRRTGCRAASRRSGAGAVIKRLTTPQSITPLAGPTV